jgi:hypothetical protein
MDRVIRSGGSRARSVALFQTLQSGNPFKPSADTGERSSDQPPEQVEVHSELEP